MARDSKPTLALALAGGNALGAYEAGAYEALHGRGYFPDLVSGASIGAINGAIIAGNAPQQRLAKLREFWSQADSGGTFAPQDGKPRELHNTAHALQTLMVGRPGLFRPRIPGLMSILPGMPPDVAIFDSRPLVATLQRVIDFDLLNSAHVPLMMSAVDMETGEAVRFDTRKAPITTTHFLATTALTPVFPPVEIEGRLLADPGLIGNLPVDAILDPPPREDLVCFAVDLFDSRGERPRSLDTGFERAQDIVFSAQSMSAIEARGREQRLRRMIADLSMHVPEDRRATGTATQLVSEGRQNQLTIVLLAYRARAHELSAKTLEFSRASIKERWALGLEDMNAALDKLEKGDATVSERGYSFYDARRRP